MEVLTTGTKIIKFNEAIAPSLRDLLSIVWEDLDGGVLLDKKQYLSEGG